MLLWNLQQLSEGCFFESGLRRGSLTLCQFTGYFVSCGSQAFYFSIDKFYNLCYNGRIWLFFRPIFVEMTVWFETSFVLVPWGGFGIRRRLVFC